MFGNGAIGLGRVESPEPGSREQKILWEGSKETDVGKSSEYGEPSYLKKNVRSF